MNKKVKELQTDKKEKAEPIPKPKVKSDFKYIVRIANTELDGTQDLVHALTGIKGIGIRVAECSLRTLKLPQHELIGNLSEDQIANIEKTLANISNTLPPWILNRQRERETGKNLHAYGQDLDVWIRENINLMKMIRCYRGIRHERGQKVRGQRTKSKGRKGLVVGVQRKGVRGAKQSQTKKKKGGE